MKRLVQELKDSGIGLVYQNPEQDKYTFAHQACVVCLECLPTCKAICCKFSFALPKQDIDESILRWDFGRPYMIAQDENGHCVYLDCETYQCIARENRPLPCRGVDCSRSNRWRVWQDYEKKIVNSESLESLESNRENKKNGLPNH